jgi:hypothetical protein
MPVSYEKARDIIRRRLEPTWTHGTFCLDDRNIVENDEFYVFAVGSREFLVDGDESYEAVGGVSAVYKEDGRVNSLAAVAVATDRPSASRLTLLPR